MCEQFGLNKKTLDLIRTVLASYPQITSAILFGSRAKGNYKKGSDIDLTLKGHNLDISLVHKIETSLDDCLLPYTLDISLYKQIDNPELIDHISRVGILFYRKEDSA